MIAIASQLPSTGRPLLAASVSALLVSSTLSFGGIQIVVGHHADGQTTPSFAFANVPSPSKIDAATPAKFMIVDGEPDSNGGGLEKLHDGKMPTERDEPAENFFFDAGSEGGRIRVDFGSALEIKQVNTYSWHPTTRGPQVYKLYASEGPASDFIAKPGKVADPEKSAWKLIARVDTRSKGGTDGGQYGVSISDSDGLIGKFRYLLFDIARTESDDDFGNTFYSEIDVIGADDGAAANLTAEKPAPIALAAPERSEGGPFKIKSTDGYCEISIDTSGEPELKEWAEQKLAPVLAEWYPKITAMLASDGFDAPKEFSVTIKPGSGVAATGGARVTANSSWLKRELKGEAVGALLHEEVHVVQRYGGGRRGNPDFKRPPGWLVEGIPDYIRWFLFEPQSHGADLIWLQGRRNVTLNYDARYRITANFLNYVVEHYDKEKTLITKINAACRQGKYADDMWKDLTGKPLAELNDEWKASVQKQLAAKATTSQPPTAK